jgi:hypothetical protein
MVRFCGWLGHFAAGFGGNDRRPGRAGTSLPGERVVETENHDRDVKAQFNVLVKRHRIVGQWVPDAQPKANCEHAPFV